jgi:hypothetical protein
VRLRHVPSGLRVIAEESRSQAENRSRALRRLRRALYLHIRDRLEATALTTPVLESRPEYRQARAPDGRLHLVRKDPRFWPAAGFVLDVLEAVEGRVSAAAALLGLSTGNLVDFLETDPNVWQQANQMRMRFGQRPLVH